MLGRIWGKKKEEPKKKARKKEEPKKKARKKDATKKKAQKKDTLKNEESKVEEHSIEEVEETKKRTKDVPIEKKSIKTKSGRLLQIIDTKIKYKYTIKDLFEIMMDLRPPASHLHISTNYRPYFRYHNKVLASDLPPLPYEEAKKLLYEYCPEDKIEELENNFNTEFCNEIPGLTKFKAKLSKENNGIGGIFKPVFSKILSIDQLKLPKVYKDIAKSEEGLIILSGPNCCGTTASIASLIKFISNTRFCKILILEKTLEYIHPTKKSLVVHKEVGTDVTSYEEGLKLALKEDTDIIVIDDISSKEVIDLAFKACNMGKLVIGGFYTTGTVKTLEHIVKIFPEEKSEEICLLLSENLKAIINQLPVKTKDVKGKKIVSEILLSNPEVKMLIKQANFYGLPRVMERSKEEGMGTFSSALKKLTEQNKITKEEAEEYTVI